MNWCEESAERLIFITKTNDFHELIEDYAKNKCQSKNINLKIYYIDFFQNNPIKFKKITSQVTDIVYNFDFDFIQARRLPFTTSENSPLLPLIKYLISEVNEHFKTKFSLSDFLDNQTIFEKHSITFQTYFIDLVGQILYNDLIHESAYLPLYDLVKEYRDISSAGHIYNFIKKTLNEEIEENTDDVKRLFLQTIKEHLKSDKHPNDIAVLYVTRQVKNDMIGLGVIRMIRP